MEIAIAQCSSALAFTEDADQKTFRDSTGLDHWLGSVNGIVLARIDASLRYVKSNLQEWSPRLIRIHKREPSY